MNDHDDGAGRRGGAGTSRRRIDVTTLILALVLLAIAAIGLGGYTRWLNPHLLPWALAGAVALVGVGLIVSTLPRRNRDWNHRN